MDPFQLGQNVPGASGGPAQLPPGQQMPQAAPAGSAPDPMAHVEASYNKLREAQGVLRKVRSGLDSLVALADTVTQDDVIKVAGKLVGGGITPEGMAALLAEMPDSNPEQLMQWIAGHDADVTKREADLNKMTQQFRHELGVQAVNKIVGNGRAEASQAPAPVEGPTQMTQPSGPPSAGGTNAMGL